MTTVHLVEPGGRGGVYQHTVALGQALVAAGVDVELRTAARPEPLPVEVTAPLRSRPCLWTFPNLRPRAVRRLAAAAGWLVVGVPSCVARARPGDVLHAQGRFREGLLVPLVVGARLRGCRLVLSPHTTFSRRRRAGEDRLMAWLARRAHAVVVFSDFDRVRVQGWGARPVLAPLPLVAPAPAPEDVAAWRARWRGDGARRVVLLAGQLRPDKGLDVAVRAAATWGDEVVLAVVGEDQGGLAPARRLAHRLGVPVAWADGYQPLPTFVAALAAADVVACPYRVGSQSAVLGLARALGRPTVATAVGGLAELATVVVPPDDPDALADGVRRALRAPPPSAADQPDVAACYARVYGL